VKETIVIDTNLLMQYGKDVLKKYSNRDIIISLVTLEELDNLKTKSGVKGFLARQGIRAFSEYEDVLRVDTAITTKEVEKLGLTTSTKNQNDSIILSTAIRNDSTLLTNDVSLRIKAEAIGVDVYEFHGEREYYNKNGWKKVVLEDSELSNFYTDFEINPRQNFFDLKVNEYSIVLNQEKEPSDCYKWDGEETIRVNPNVLLKSNMLQVIKPLDFYQVAAIDSLNSNALTMITGSAGTGKSLLGLGYCLQEIEQNRALRVNIFINPVSAKGTVDLGAYPGTRDEKLMNKNLGSMLVGKLKSASVVHKMIEEGSLRIYPISEIRGLEIGPSEILYIPEAQNTTSDMIKLAIQRVATGAKVIVEGDINQSDNNIFSSGSNGLKRLTEVFTDTHLAGRVFLPKVYRSEIAEIALQL
jgi:PhoH-like ATPase